MKLLQIGLIATAMGLSSVCAAQPVKDPKAQEILKGVSSKYKSLKSLSASFRISNLDQKSKVTDSQTGSLLVKGNKYKLTLKGQEVISDGSIVWTYLKESNEVQVNSADDKNDALSPTNIFTIYEKGFSTKFAGEKKEGTKNLQQVELVPDDAKKSFFKIQLFIDKSEKMISYARVLNKNGSILTYQMDQLKMNPDAPDAQFTFDKTKYPGVEVVDLR